VLTGGEPVEGIGFRGLDGHGETLAISSEGIVTRLRR
jgi:hypothetical protein